MMINGCSCVCPHAQDVGDWVRALGWFLDVPYLCFLFGIFCLVVAVCLSSYINYGSPIWMAVTAICVVVPLCTFVLSLFVGHKTRVQLRERMRTIDQSSTEEGQQEMREVAQDEEGDKPPADL